MKITKHNGWAQVSEWETPEALYNERDSFSDASVLLIHAENPEETVSEAVKAWLLSVPFLTVIAAEEMEKFSYDLLSLFDVRLARAPYPAASAKADARYRLLCGDTAYEMLRSGNTEAAPNFVTVPETEGAFHTAAETYIKGICGEKTPEQLAILVGCLKAAVSGGTEAVFSAESNGFYSLMAQKTEGQSDE